MESPAPYHLSPEAPGTEPPGFDSRTTAPATEATPAPGEVGALGPARGPLALTEQIKLRRLAENAPFSLLLLDGGKLIAERPGSEKPWLVAGFYDFTLNGGEARRNAAYMAEASPATILRLLDQLAAAEAQAAKVAEQVAGLKRELGEQEVEKLALVRENQEQGKQLFKALSVLAGMWNQYCPPPTEKCPYPGHMFMSAGEDCEELLEQWGLMRGNETAIDCDFASEFAEAPQKVRALLSPPPAPAPPQPEALAAAADSGNWQFPGMPEAKCHGCALPSHAARCRTVGCPGKQPEAREKQGEAGEAVCQCTVAIWQTDRLGQQRCSRCNLLAE